MKNFKPILTAMSLCMALAAAAAPVRQHLHDDWQFRQARLNNWYPATVPGTVHTDLMANRIIEDPYFRLNERGVQWVDKEDWIYETHFEADAGLLARERIELVFEGLDTYADVYLNDEKVLAADNMFRRWRTEVKRLLRPGENTLKVYFHSPIKVDLPKYDSLPYRYEAVNDQSANGGLFDKRVSVFARKAGYHYGWDWGPRLVTSGIWRPVYLEGWSGARISDVFYRQQEVTARRARVEVEVEIASARDLAEAVVTVASPGEGIEASVTAPLRSGINKVTVPLDIASPKLWWTRELGEPHLYEFRASVAAGDASDSRTTRIGLRSLRLVRDKVADGTTFYFELNGEPLFAKGANYIPCDVFLPRVTRAVYEKTLDDAAAVNMNMLRVWGGGVYGADVFYELCDERGMARKRPARSRRQHPPSAQPPLDRRMVRQQRVQRSVVRLGMEHPVRRTGASRMGPDHRRPAPPPILRSAARSRRRLLARHALPPLVALVASRRHERKQRRRYAFLESVAQPRTDRRLQRHAQPLLQRIRLPVVPRIRLRPAFRPRRARLGH